MAAWWGKTVVGVGRNYGAHAAELGNGELRIAALIEDGLV